MGLGFRFSHIHELLLSDMHDAQVWVWQSTAILDSAFRYGVAIMSRHLKIVSLSGRI